MAVQPPGGAPTVAVLGCGHLGARVLSALLEGGHPPDRLCGTTRTAARAEQLTREHGVRVGTDNAAAATGRRVLVLTVPPVQARGVLATVLPRLSPGAAVLSFVAGLALGDVSPAGSALRVFRVATNVALIGPGGQLAVSAASGPSREADQVLHLLGAVQQVPESAQDVAAATLGSGAAFLAFVGRGLVSAAVRQGVDERTAHRFAVAAASSAATLLAEGAPGAPAPWHALATPGGITAAGLESLRASSAEDAMASAVDAAVARAATVGALGSTGPGPAS